MPPSFRELGTPETQLPRISLLGDSMNKLLSKMHRGSEDGIMAAGEIPPFSSGREEKPCAYGQTPPAHHVLRLGLRVFMVAPPVRRLLAARATRRCPYRARHNRGPGGAAGAGFPDDSVARRVDLIRSGLELAAGGPPDHRGTECRARSGRPVAGPVQPLIRHHPGFRAAAGQPPGCAVRRGTGLSRLRSAPPPGRPLAALSYSDPRGARGRLACAPAPSAVRSPPARSADDSRGDVLVHVVVQPYWRQR